MARPTVRDEATRAPAPSSATATPAAARRSGDGSRRRGDRRGRWAAGVGRGGRADASLHRHRDAGQRHGRRPCGPWCSVQGGHGVIAAPPAVGPRGRGDTRGPVMPVGVARGARGGGSATLWCLQGAGRRAGATVRRCDAGRVVVEAVVPALDLADARRRWSRPTRRPSASVTPAVEWIEAVAPTVGLPEQPRPSLGGGGIVADWGRARGRRGRQRLPGSRWPRRVGVTTARRARSRGGSLAPVCTSSGWSSRARAGASASGRAGPSGRAGRSAPRW